MIAVHDLGAGCTPSVAVLLSAFALDCLFGEPPAAVHPVVWMGRVVAPLERAALRLRRFGQLLAGALIAIAVPSSFAIAGALFAAAAGPWPLVQLLVAIAMLKPMFALRELGRAAARVRDSLAAGRLEQARRDLGSLCSRDASRLDPPQLVGGAVESLAENLSDSVVAPLFYYALFGLPGAIFYRAVNTLDAMIGYRGRHEYLGKASARLDDALNYVPARLTALLLLAAGWFARAAPGRGWRMLRRDGARTASPNAGRPMAAMAGLLGVELEKPGHYRLGDPESPLVASHIDDAWRAAQIAAALAAALLVALIGARRAALG